MVSKARLLLPEPERPVMTTNLSRGMVTSIFFRLCSRAPRTMILSWGIQSDHPSLAGYKLLIQTFDIHMYTILPQSRGWEALRWLNTVYPLYRTIVVIAF